MLRHSILTAWAALALVFAALRLEAARHFLRNTSLQTGEVAQRCGFNSASYFIRVFAKRWGVTPKSRAGQCSKECPPK